MTWARRIRSRLRSSMMTGSMSELSRGISPVLNQSKPNQNPLKTQGCFELAQILSDNDDCSTGTPGPIVEDTDTFLR
jgi:hypothetical protein